MTQQEIVRFLIDTCLQYEDEGRYEERETFLSSMHPFTRCRVMMELRKLRESALDM